MNVPEWAAEVLKNSANFRPVDPNEPITHCTIGGKKYLFCIRRGYASASIINDWYLHHAPRHIDLTFKTFNNFRGLTDWNPDTWWPIVMRREAVKRIRKEVEPLPIP